MKKKKILSWLLVLAMCLTLIPAAAVPVAAAESHSGHCVCGASSCTAEDSYHQHSTPTSWTGITSLDSIKGDGAYYLGTNITLSQTWTCNYNVVLCLNGKTISCTGDATVIELTSGHTLQITDCHKGSNVGTITGNNTGNKRGIISYGTLYLWNGNITGNKAGGVAVNGSQFYMYGGKISNNSTEADPGAGVYVGCANSSVGVFRMYGGEISGNSSNNLNGGGVYVSSSASFYLEGGSILHNTAAKGGGGVFTSGTFAMSDSAEVSYNTAVSEGGGVYNNNDGKFTMTGGKITNNIAATGGGVYLGINDQGVMTLSGKARIAGNKAGNANSNLYLPSGKTVIAKDLTAGAGIGVSTQADLVEGNVLVTSDAVSANYFTSDNTTYETKLTEGTTSANRVILTQRSLYETKHEHSCVCGATHSGTIGDHDTAADLTNWVGVSDLNMITGAGNYYLLDSVTLTEAVAVRDLAERSGTTYCGWDVPDDVVLCLNGHNITMHNPEGQNNVDVIHVTGEFTLTDCTSTQGRITHTSGEVGRGLEVQGGTFNMYGGQITGNRTPEYGTGGGVHVEGIMDTTKTSVFNLYKGSISGNTSGYGGGVYVNRNVDNGLSQFNMYGGSISNNTCTVSNDTSSYGVGGGVNVSWTAAFKMTGGSITGNTAKFGGAGVYLSALARSSQSDSSEQRTAEFKVSGRPNITGNKTNSAENNVYLDTSTDSYWVGYDVPRKVETVRSSITILEGLSDGARIGVTTGATPTSGNRVLVATDANSSTDYSNIFTSDVSGYEVQNLKNTTLMLAVTGDTKPEPDHVHNWTYALKTGTTDTIVAKCDVAGCSSPNGGSVQILKPTQLKPNQAATLNEINWKGENVTVKYVKYNDGGVTSYPFEYLPTTAPATYHAQITLGTVTAKTEPYTITEDGSTPTPTPDPTPTTITVKALDRSVTVGGTVPDLSQPVLGTDYTVTGLVGTDELGGTIAMKYQQNDKDVATPDTTQTGTYDIVVSGVTAPEGGNYNEIVFEKGTLNIVKRSSNSKKVYYYNVTVSETENGTAEVSDRSASKGDTVTVTAKPDSGFVIDKVEVKDAAGNAVKLTESESGKYTFTMPGSDVEIKASFTKEAQEEIKDIAFADVSEEDYFCEAVKWAAEKKITTGVDDSHFAPNDKCTRAQIVTFLWRAAGSPEVTTDKTFSDIDSDSYYAKAVAWAVANGITTGTDDSHFSPDDTCTRAQSVTFLARALKGTAEAAAEFTDVAADGYYASAVAWAKAKGITTGVSESQFGPDEDCTRAQIVTFLYRAYEAK